MERKKKKYDKPKVIHREKIEVLAAVCNSAWVPSQSCMKACPKPKD